MVAPEGGPVTQLCRKDTVREQVRERGEAASRDPYRCRAVCLETPGQLGEIGDGDAADTVVPVFALTSFEASLVVGVPARPIVPVIGHGHITQF
jgi:hypothetical protein